ncbi:tyrosine-protein kinase STYK1 isoform X1 [Zootoca vivipara]|uniref:tyrosine-protein kinase STYK1 isoform X1 n=2 Tax=Zootoca vivipara TaxID=8524 RepID=UPI00293BE25E|nr:tyrosine-protein kinase STYK1 isoform X1 [Zootoca vivipara]XP_034996771.2 tyrosine-protein kinase STYK1 isoform X1 [Zootoca vivipara]XP_034996773.2 tyrosine-protein kinase STYK1 isoform X1 [Zootoca vivipara]XP_060124647.1 tyrosine-protein kinase STYK1 isoform X1 [Zootoca vivipara]
MVGEIRRLSRTLLDCQKNDELCVVRENQTEVIIVPVLLIGVFVIILSVILWLHYQSIKAKQQTSPESREEGHVPVSEKKKSPGKTVRISEHTTIQLNETTRSSLLKTAALTFKELEIPREKISWESLKLVRNGSFGGIYRAELKTSNPGKTQPVLLKALKESASSHEIKDFMERIKFYQFLGNHENIIKLLGCCMQQMPLYMILEDASNGNLLNFLWTCRRDVVTMDGLPLDLTERQVYKIGQQIASALDFLQGKKLFHGDVAARNVLIGDAFTVKLCRLGLAYRSHTCGPSSIAQTVPLKWQAPERLLKKPPNIKSDIWSFGILLYEMITLGAPPFPEVPPSEILQHLQRQHTMKRPSSCQPAMYSIMEACWHWTPTDRPSPTELIRRLQTGIKTSNGQAVLQIPELVVPELYAAVAGIDLRDLATDYTVF